MNLPGHFILAAVSSGGSESQPLDLGGATSSAHAAGGGSIAGRSSAWRSSSASSTACTGCSSRSRPPRGARPPATGLETLATLPLGTNRALHLVRAGREIVAASAPASTASRRSARYSEEEARGARPARRRRRADAPMATRATPRLEPPPGARGGRPRARCAPGRCVGVKTDGVERGPAAAARRRHLAGPGAALHASPASPAS